MSATCPFCGDTCCVVPARAGWLCTRCGGEIGHNDWVFINQVPEPYFLEMTQDDEHEHEHEFFDGACIHCGAVPEPDDPEPEWDYGDSPDLYN